MSEHKQEVAQGQRFEFDANWTRFLSVLNDERIRMAEESLKRMLELEDLQGKSFLDIGSGSGLFSLAARRLGARVHSFDYDPQSVACTNELKRRYFTDDADWLAEEGSASSMWYIPGESCTTPVPCGRRWRKLKRIYSEIPKFLRLPYTILTMGSRELKFIAISVLTGKPAAYVDAVLNYQKRSWRGMSYWHDVVDWIGGYPFEVAKPEQIFDFYRERGFHLEKLKTCAGGLGCNEFVFTSTNDRETR